MYQKHRKPYIMMFIIVLALMNVVLCSISFIDSTISIPTMPARARTARTRGPDRLFHRIKVQRNLTGMPRPQ